MPNDEASKNLKKRAEQANQMASIITIMIFALQTYAIKIFKKFMGTLLAL
jgi:hypothetical protein